MPRRFGPQQGAGTAIIERNAGSQIVPSAFGTTCYVGATEKGDMGEIIDVPKLNQYLRKCGSFTEFGELPDNAFDFFEYSEGAGRMYVVRVTDGLESNGLDYVLSRHNGVGEYANRALGNEQKDSLLKVTAKNGGRWAGAERVISFVFENDENQLGETYLDSELSGGEMQKDEFKGATLKLLGVTTRTYEVIGNSSEGAFTVKSDSRMASDLAAGGDALNYNCVISLDNETRQFTGTGVNAGDEKTLSIVWKDGEENQDSLFGLDILVDGLVVRSYNNLSLDPDDKWYINSVVNNDPDNNFIDVEVLWAATFDKDHRPANWWGEVKSFAGATLESEIAHVRTVTSNNDVGFVGEFDYPANTVRQRLTLTFLDATSFTVASNVEYGADLKDLPNGTVGTEYATTLAADGKALLGFIPSFLVSLGVEDFLLDDTIVIDVEPFPVSFASGEGMLDGAVLLDGDNANSERAIIESNTVNTITFKNAPATPPLAAGIIPSDILSTGAITFPTAGGVLEFVCDAVGFVSLVYGVEADSATLAATLQAAATVAGLPNGLFIDGGDVVQIVMDGVTSGYQWFNGSNEVGENQFFEILSSTDAELLLTAAVYTGSTGDSYRVEAARRLRDGYDGDTPADADYLVAFNTATSVINRLRGRNVGLVKIACPGVTATQVQKAGLNYASFRNYQYRPEIPSSILLETSAVDYVNTTLGRNDYGKLIFPSYAKVVNKTGKGSTLQSLTGAVHGREAKMARDFAGFHKAAAGVSVTLPHVVELPTGEAILNEEILNPQGLNVVKKLKGNFVIWGDRTISILPEWQFAHAREYVSHIENVLIENFDFVIFSLNDPTQREQLIPVFQTFFRPELGKRAIVGAKLEDAVSIKIDGENNTKLTTAAGDLNAEINMNVVDVVERFIISVSKAGVTASVA